MKTKLAMIVMAVCVVACIHACSSNSDPTDPDGGGNGGPPAGAAVSASMNGFFGDGYFSVEQEDWHTSLDSNRTYFKWYGDSCSFCIQLPVGHNSNVSLPMTWNVKQGGFCADNNYASVSIEETENSAPSGYDGFLAVSGQLTLTGYDLDTGFSGSFHFVVGAFSLGDGYQYGGDHSYDTTFTNGTFESQTIVGVLGK